MTRNVLPCIQGNCSQDSGFLRSRCNGACYLVREHRWCTVYCWRSNCDNTRPIVTRRVFLKRSAVDSAATVPRAIGILLSRHDAVSFCRIICDTDSSYEHEFRCSLCSCHLFDEACTHSGEWIVRQRNFKSGVALPSLWWNFCNDKIAKFHPLFFSKSVILSLLFRSVWNAYVVYRNSCLICNTYSPLKK